MSRRFGHACFGRNSPRAPFFLPFFMSAFTFSFSPCALERPPFFSARFRAALNRALGRGGEGTFFFAMRRNAPNSVRPFGRCSELLRDDTRARARVRGGRARFDPFDQFDRFDQFDHLFGGSVAAARSLPSAILRGASESTAATDPNLQQLQNLQQPPTRHLRLTLKTVSRRVRPGPFRAGRVRSQGPLKKSRTYFFGP